MSKAKAVTGENGQETQESVNLKFVDYRKCNSTRLKVGEIDIALIKGKNGQRYTKVTDASGKIILFIGARKDGTGTWNRTQVESIAADGSKTATRESVTI